MTRVETIADIFQCVSCQGALARSGPAFVCGSCGTSFELRDGRVVFEAYTDTASTRPDEIVYRLKRYLKKEYPRLFFLVYRLVNARVGPDLSRMVESLPSDARVVNIGAGAKPVHPRVFNLDIVPEPGVDIVASAYALPFKDESVDMFIAESILEHLITPEKAVAEMRRALKPRGTLFVVTPFMFGFHSSPGDYYRWTIPGMTALLSGFTMRDTGVQIGPTGAFAAIAREWLAMLLSFNNRTLYQLWTLFFMAALIPLNIFDWLISRYSFATQIAMEYYFVAEKTGAHERDTI